MKRFIWILFSGILACNSTCLAQSSDFTDENPNGAEDTEFAVSGMDSGAHDIEHSTETGPGVTSWGAAVQKGPSLSGQETEEVERTTLPGMTQSGDEKTGQGNTTSAGADTAPEGAGTY